jgi:hypothetical protein
VGLETDAYGLWVVRLGGGTRGTDPPYAVVAVPRSGTRFVGRVYL